MPDVLGGAPAQPAGRVAVVAVHHDLPQSLGRRAGTVGGLAAVKDLQQPTDVVADGAVAVRTPVRRPDRSRYAAFTTC